MDTPKAEEHTSKDTLEDTSKAMSVTSLTPLQYKTILVPHDGSTTADIALKHAIYLSNVSGAEIIILNVLENLDSVDSSAVLATSGKDIEAKSDYEITLEGKVKNMIEEKIKLCKKGGLKGQVSYKIQTGKPVEEIIKVSEEMYIDLLVMASSKSSSLVSKILGSTVRRVIDNIKNPVLIVGSEGSKDNVEDRVHDSTQQHEGNESISPAKTKEHEPTAAKEIMDVTEKSSEIKDYSA
ncbi:MAG: universal stress protein [Candidatus Nitrosopolaris sp.]